MAWSSAVKQVATAVGVKNTSPGVGNRILYRYGIYHADDLPPVVTAIPSYIGIRSRRSRLSNVHVARQQCRVSKRSYFIRFTKSRHRIGYANTSPLGRRSGTAEGGVTFQDVPLRQITACLSHEWLASQVNVVLAGFWNHHHRPAPQIFAMACSL